MFTAIAARHFYNVTIVYLYGDRDSVTYSLWAADSDAAIAEALAYWRTTAAPRDGAEFIEAFCDFQFSA